MLLIMVELSCLVAREEVADMMLTKRHRPNSLQQAHLKPARIRTLRIKRKEHPDMMTSSTIDNGKFDPSKIGKSDERARCQRRDVLYGYVHVAVARERR